MAFHKELDRVNKYTKSYLIGRVDPNDVVLNQNKSVVKIASLSESSSNSEMAKIVKEIEMKRDFENIRKIAQEMVTLLNNLKITFSIVLLLNENKKNLFVPSYAFFMLNLVQIVFFQIMGYYLLWNFGDRNMLACFCSLVCLVIAQVKFS
jgi:hypothetical protein